MGLTQGHVPALGQNESKASNNRTSLKLAKDDEVKGDGQDDRDEQRVEMTETSRELMPTKAVGLTQNEKRTPNRM